MPQAVIIFQPVNQHNLAGAFTLGRSHVVLDFESYEARQAYCDGSAVFWYQLVEDMEFEHGLGAIGQPKQQNIGVREKYAGWIKGGAWEALKAEQEHEHERKSIEMDERGDLW